MNLQTVLNQNKKVIDDQLEKFFSKKEKQHRLIDPSLSQVTQIVAKQALSGGKRIRPLLAQVSYKLSGGKNLSRATKASVSLELLHQYFLVHDDIIDRDEKRYGQPTIELQYQKLFRQKYKARDKHLGLSLGIITGDYICALAHSAILESGFNSEKITNSLKLLEKAIFLTSAGWQIQFFQNQEKLKTANEKISLKGAELVSARYTFETPLMLGTLLSGNNKYDAILKNYSKNVGLAFQIKDDILGIFGEPSITGKPAGNDFREGKKTLLVLRAYKKATNEDKKFIEKYLGKQITQTQLKRLKEIILSTKSLYYSAQLAEKYAYKGIKSIISLPNSTQKSTLEELAKFVVNRDK